MNTEGITRIPAVAVIHILHVHLILLIRIHETDHLYGISAESDTIATIKSNQIKKYSTKTKRLQGKVNR